MTLPDFRRVARRQPLQAVIISDGCRDYVVEVRSENGAGLLTDRKGRTKRFTSLSLAKSAVRRATEVRLAVRVAADEACAGETSPDHLFSDIVIGRQSAA